MTQRRTKTSSNDLSIYQPYCRDHIAKYGIDGWMTTRIKRKRYKGVDTLLSIEIIPCQR
jgi:hypothetical protein